MIAFLLSPLGRLAIAGAIGAAVGFGGAWKIQSGRIDTVKAEYNVFKGGVASLGEQAKANAAKIEAQDKLNKVKADAENARTTGKLRADVKRLRDALDAGRGGLSAPAADPASPDRTCFDPAKFNGALRSLDKGILGIVESGSKAIIDLDTAKQWATNQGVAP